MSRSKAAALHFIITLCLVATTSTLPASGAAKPKRLLLFTKSSGFEHPAIKTRGLNHDEPSLVQGVFADLSRKHGWEVVHSKDGSLFSPDKRKELESFDGFVFYTSGDLTKPGSDAQPPMPPEGKALLLELIHQGKGWVGVHGASDTFHSAGDRYESDGKNVDPFLRMVGGEFISHSTNQQIAEAIVVDPKFPGLANAGKSIVITEEWYSLKNLAPDMHAVLVLQTKGMESREYDRPPFPIAWARKHGRGKVFFTALGHREDVWAMPAFQDHLAGGIQWSIGEKKHSAKPNLETAAPGAQTLPPKPKTP